MNLCWFCGTQAVLPGKIQRKDICGKCKMALKCCRNCRLFDPSAPKQCREPAAENVGDKDGANFCEYFDFLVTQGSTVSPRKNTQEDAKKKFDSLFRK